jgi:uncharacterized LabA/DUF88 family protein
LKNFIFIYTESNKSFKNFIKGKKGYIAISYIDILENQNNFLVLDEEKISIKILQCELYEKIYNSLRKIQKSDKIDTIFYFLDTYNENILRNIIKNINSFCKKISFNDLDYFIYYIDNIDNADKICLEKELKK